MADFIVFDKFKVIKVKSDDQSVAFREKGNSFFKQLKIFDAILAYNMAIALAKSKLNLALAYGNRSAAYFEAKLYAECLKSIKLAKESGFPAEKMEKLIEREQKCLKLMAEQEEKDSAENLWSYMKLSYPANKKLPWMIEDLEVRQTEKYGRGIYTKRDLKAGDIICIEEAKIQLVDSERFFLSCENCTKTCKMNLIPCLKTGSLMFCSIACRDAFYNYADLSKNKFDKIEFHHKKIEAAFGNLNKVKEYVDQHPITTIFDFDLSNDEDPNYLLNIYKCLLTIGESYSSTGDEVLLVEKVLMSFMCSSRAVLHIKHSKSIFSEKKVASISNLVLTTHKHSFTTFPILLRSYSQMPNIGCFWIDNTAVYYVQFPIKAGEQLFVSPNGDFADMSDCANCIHNRVPTNIEGKTKLFKTGIFTDGVGSYESALERIAKLFEILNYPVQECCCDHITATKSIRNIFLVLADRLMYGF